MAFSIVDKSGRKVLLVISALLMSICYAGLGGFYLIKTHDPRLAAQVDWLPLLCITVYISAFSIGYGPVPWVLMGEIYSSEVRDRVVGRFSAVNGPALVARCVAGLDGRAADSVYPSYAFRRTSDETRRGRNKSFGRPKNRKSRRRITALKLQTHPFIFTE